MRCCSAASSGAPSGRPYGYGTHKALGGFTFSVCSRTSVMPTVTSPARSRARDSTPTVCEHSGQVPVRKTYSTPSSRKRRPTSAPLVFERSVRRPLRTHEGVHIRTKAAYRVLLHQLAHAVQWQHDVDVALDGRTIEPDAGVRLDEVARIGAGGEDAEARIAGVRTGGRHGRAVQPSSPAPACCSGVGVLA